MDDSVEKIKMKDVFRVCPACGYEDGFHSMLRKSDEKTCWLFICAACHKVFDIGFDFKTMTPAKGFCLRLGGANFQHTDHCPVHGWTTSPCTAPAVAPQRTPLQEHVFLTG